MMRERASQLNGKFEFESAPGRGTTIRVAIPFR
jgi:signal transduction histidine kinase